MVFTPISNDFIQYQATASGTSAAAYFLKLYASGTTTPISAALDSAGSVLVAKVELDSLGFAKNGSGGATTVYIDQTYRLVLYVNSTDADNNTFANAVQDIDDIPQVLTQAAVNEVITFTRKFDAVATALADVNIVDGDALNIAEFATGDGGGAMWDVVLASSVTIDGFLFQQCTGVPTLALVYRIGFEINITEIGAKDDFSGALQAAFDFSVGLIPVICSEGTYIADTQVDMLTSTDETTVYQPSNSFVGAGSGATIIVNRTGTNWLIHKPSTAQATTGIRMVGFKLNGYTLTIDGSSPAGSEAALIYSAWLGGIEDVEDLNQDGNGFTLPRDDALNSNVDRYACGHFSIKKYRSQSNGGIGINSENPSNTLITDKLYVIGNKLGGFLLTGSKHIIGTGSIAGCGEDNGVSGVDGFGLHIAHSTGFAPSNVMVHGLEIDNNFGRDIICDGSQCEINVRVIQNGATGFVATDVLFFNSFASGTARDNRVELRIRIDNADTNAINIVTTTDTAGTQDNHVNLLYSATGDDSNVVKANLLGTSRQRNTVSEGGQVIGNSTLSAISNTNKAFIKPSSTVTLTNVAAILKFSKTWDDFGLWDNTLFTYTAPHKGLCTISFSAPFRAIVASDPITLTVKVNGSSVQSISYSDGVTSTSDSQNLAFNATVAVESGQTVEIFGQTASVNGAFFLSDTDTTTKIFME